MSQAQMNFKLADDGTLSLAGSLTRSAIPAQWDSLNQLLKEKSVKQVDVAKVKLIDTAGVAVLLEVIKHNRDAVPLPCDGASDQLRQIVSVSGVDHLLSLS